MTALGWRVFALLVAMAFVPTMDAAPFAGIPGAAVPVAVLTAAFVAALAFVLGACAAGPVATVSVGAIRVDRRARRRPPRSADPDAAGHVRPRAPGSISAR